MASATRQSAFNRLQARVHAHPRARVLEFLFWGIPGAISIVLAYVGVRADGVNDALAIILGIIGLCLIGWGLLPPSPKKVEAKPHEKSRRAVPAKARK